MSVGVGRVRHQLHQQPVRHHHGIDLLLRADHHDDHHHAGAARGDHRIPARDGGRPGLLPLPHHLRSRVRRQHLRRQRDRLGDEGSHVQGPGRQRSRGAVAVRRHADARVDVRSRLHHRQRDLGVRVRRAGRQRRRGQDAGRRREAHPRVDDVAGPQPQRLRLLQEHGVRRRLHDRFTGDGRQVHAQSGGAELGLPRRLRGLGRRRRVRGQGLRRREHLVRSRVAVEGEHQHRQRDAAALRRRRLPRGHAPGRRADGTRHRLPDGQLPGGATTPQEFDSEGYHCETVTVNPE